MDFIDFETKLAGVTKGNCQRNIKVFANQWARFHLVREPLNEYDPNAIKVQAHGHLLGYVDKRTAAMVAPVLDSFPGEIGVAFVKQNTAPEKSSIVGVTVLIFKITNGGKNDG